MVVRIGTSGWSYAHWDGVLYPPGTPPAARLGLYTSRFSTVELNASFYRWPPEGFQLSVKAARGLTHAKRLHAPEACATTRGWSTSLANCRPWMRVAVEFRHPSWHETAVLDILERHRAGYCVMSGANLPCILRATAPFVYVRLHGPDSDHLYARLVLSAGPVLVG